MCIRDSLNIINPSRRVLIIDPQDGVDDDEDEEPDVPFPHKSMRALSSIIGGWKHAFLCSLKDAKQDRISKEELLQVNWGLMQHSDWGLIDSSANTARVGGGNGAAGGGGGGILGGGPGGVGRGGVFGGGRGGNGRQVQGAAMSEADTHAADIISQSLLRCAQHGWGRTITTTLNRTSTEVADVSDSVTSSQPSSQKDVVGASISALNFNFKRAIDVYREDLTTLVDTIADAQRQLDVQRIAERNAARELSLTAPGEEPESDDDDDASAAEIAPSQQQPASTTSSSSSSSSSGGDNGDTNPFYTPLEPPVVPPLVHLSFDTDGKARASEEASLTALPYQVLQGGREMSIGNMQKLRVRRGEPPLTCTLQQRLTTNNNGADKIGSSPLSFTESYFPLWLYNHAAATTTRYAATTSSSCSSRSVDPWTWTLCSSALTVVAVDIPRPEYIRILQASDE
eukprot:TRINITY_DN6940_c0_g1_i10.p1 TRINITY_DN6940_c0_g1~~TRINITY_DN6940_c0_g1_i10.p1  ORF type:complete len:455 (+),score=62.47 TRINITY_DN6940_c0_g1_i10:155-1519(+)